MGVTGGGLAPCDRRPRLSKRARRSEAPAEAAEAGEAPDADELPPGFVPLAAEAPKDAGVTTGAPISPSLPSAPRLAVPTPPRDDPPAAVEPAPPSAPAKSKRPTQAKQAKPAKQLVKPSPAAPGNEGAAIVGRRVEAWWDVYKCYFPGVLESYDEATGEHTIRYDDDNSIEVVTLPDDTVRYETAK